MNRSEAADEVLTIGQTQLASKRSATTRSDVLVQQLFQRATKILRFPLKIDVNFFATRGGLPPPTFSFAVVGCGCQTNHRIVNETKLVIFYLAGYESRLPDGGPPMLNRNESHNTEWQKTKLVMVTSVFGSSSADYRRRSSFEI